MKKNFLRETSGKLQVSRQLNYFQRVWYTAISSAVTDLCYMLGSSLDLVFTGFSWGSAHIFLGKASEWNF